MQSTIYTNMDSVRNYNIFNINSNNASKAMERATTGLKIIGAKDGTSQYAISEKMRERINSNEQASQNVQNGNAMARSADAGLENTINILKTLKARAINAANDSNTGNAASTESDRLTIQKEVDALLEQIDYNATNTQYNGKTLLNGTYDGERVNNATKAVYSNAAIETDKSSDLATKLGIAASKSQTASLIVSWAQGGEFHKNESITNLAPTKTVADIVTDVNNIISGVASIKSYALGTAITDFEDKNGAQRVPTVAETLAISTSTGKEANFNDLTIKVVSNVDPTKYLEYKFNTNIQEAQDKNTNPDSLNFQIGESANMSMQLNIADMSAAGLGIQNLNVKTRENAQYSIEAIDKALQTALEQQTSLGAMEQRLGYTADTLDTINENLQASDSTIRDADMAKEISNYMKWNVLSQASQYMLAQSNQNAYSALNLLQ